MSCTHHMAVYSKCLYTRKLKITYHARGVDRVKFPDAPQAQPPTVLASEVVDSTSLVFPLIPNLMISIKTATLLEHIYTDDTYNHPAVKYDTSPRLELMFIC
jgi:hypothetical protein